MLALAALEWSHSGLVRSLGKRVWVTPSRFESALSALCAPDNIGAFDSANLPLALRDILPDRQNLSLAEADSDL